MGAQAISTTSRSRRDRPANDYADLKRLVTERGLLQRADGYYALKCAVGIGTVAGGVALALLSPWPALVIVAAVLMGFAFTQLALLAHDIGHRQAFRGRRLNRVAVLIAGNLMLGISHSWWITKHNQHHSTPNHLEKDPDIQFPFLAFSAEQVATRPRFMRPLMGVQAFVLVFLFPLQAIQMRVTSAQHVIAQGAPRPVLQALVMVGHFALYGVLLWAIGSWPLAIAFAAVHQGVFGLYNSSVFASNHKGMALIREDTRMDFFREQVLTARNVRSHPLTDFWYGGLNYQIEHHLFPTMPRKHLAAARPIVEAFCAERGVAYHTTSLAEAYMEGFRHLQRTGRGEAVAALPAVVALQPGVRS